MRAAEGAIGRARTRARAHNEIVEDSRELGQLQLGQVIVMIDLTHAWPHAG